MIDPNTQRVELMTTARDMLDLLAVWDGLDTPAAVYATPTLVPPPWWRRWRRWLPRRTPATLVPPGEIGHIWADAAAAVMRRQRR